MFQRRVLLERISEYSHSLGEAVIIACMVLDLISGECSFLDHYLFDNNTTHAMTDEDDRSQ